MPNARLPKHLRPVDVEVKITGKSKWRQDRTCVDGWMDSASMQDNPGAIVIVDEKGRELATVWDNIHWANYAPSPGQYHETEADVLEEYLYDKKNGYALDEYKLQQNEPAKGFVDLVLQIPTLVQMARHLAEGRIEQAQDLARAFRLGELT